MKIYLEIPADVQKKLHDELNEWKTKKSLTLKKTLKVSASRVAERAKRNAWGYRRSGDMVEGITTRQKFDGWRQDVVSKEYYGRFVEVGTSRQAPKPYLAPALKDEEKLLENELIQELSKP